MADEVKERPDSPGVWWLEGVDVPAKVFHGDHGRGRLVALWFGATSADAICEGRWIQHDLTPPEFPQLPKYIGPPIRVLASRDGDEEEWWTHFRGCTFAGEGTPVFVNINGHCVRPSVLCVRVHEDNDPEAVAAIERAKQ